MVEEAYEAVDAIEADDGPHMLEELGDGAVRQRSTPPNGSFFLKNCGLTM